MGSKMYMQDKVPRLLEQTHKMWSTSVDQDLELAIVNIYISVTEQSTFALVAYRLHVEH